MQTFFAIMLGITSSFGIIFIVIILCRLLQDYFDWLQGIQLLNMRISRLEDIVNRLESGAFHS